MRPRDDLLVTLIGAVAEEIHDVRLLIEALAEVLVADEYLATTYTDQLQTFDLLVQRAQESASLLEKVAGGHCMVEAVDQVRLERVQERLRSAMKKAA